MNDQRTTLATAEARIDPTPATLSIEDLDQRILSLSARMTAQEYEFLTLVREFDERGGWLKWGPANCADWLHWRCDISLSAAREKIRVAHALKALPEISDAYRRGVLSYSKARALTRVATPDTEPTLLRYALSVSAALVEQHCQQLKNVRPESVAIAQRAHERRNLFATRNRTTGVLTVTVELPIEDGEVVLNALDRVLEEQPETPTPAFRIGPVRQTRCSICAGRSWTAADPSAEGLQGVMSHSKLLQLLQRLRRPRQTTIKWSSTWTKAQ